MLSDLPHPQISLHHMHPPDTTHTRTSTLAMLRPLWRALRPFQAPKNGLVLVPLVFSVNIWWTPDDLVGMASIATRGVIATVAFVLVSSAIYLANDIADLAADREHPQKRNRPIASGAVPVPVAAVTAVVLVAIGAGLALTVSLTLMGVVMAFVVINILYNHYLKHIVLLDVMSIAAGFVLRAVAGAVAIDQATLQIDGVVTVIDIVVSPWLFLVTGLGAMLLALSKRRAELAHAGDRAELQRPLLKQYSLQLLDMLIGIAATTSVIAYALYTFSLGTTGGNVPTNSSMMLTIPFVGYGIMRYLYLLYVKGDGEAPEAILYSDKPMLINLALWLITSATILQWDNLTG